VISRPRATLLRLLVIAIVFCAVGQTQTVVNPAVVPAEQKESWWANRHSAILQVVKSHTETELLLIGDSITHNYEKDYPPDINLKPIWDQYYAPRHALNLGFGGDTTAHVLWRLEHGEVDGLHPKVALVLIGSNNSMLDQTAEQVVAGIDAVVADLERRLPETRILLIGILPTGINANKTNLDRAINRSLANRYGENPRVTFLDIGSIFYRAGELRADLFYDPRMPQHYRPLHPDTKGQRMMTEAIEPTLSRLMGDAPRVPLASMSDINTALIPVERLEQDSYDWYARHHAELALLKQKQPDVVLLGDSITHFWGGLPMASQVNGPKAWDRVFGAFFVVNAGFGWDRTQNVLWRLRQGEFDAVHPKWVVLNIGTNNLTGTSHARANTPEEIVEAIGAICLELKQRSPTSHIIVMGIFPRGKTANSPLRAAIQKTNELLARSVAGQKLTTFVDIGRQFLEPDGTLPKTMMPDGTHPSDAGYELWANALIKAGIRPTGHK